MKETKDRANAEYIVRACNSLPDLLEALKEWLRIFDNPRMHFDDCNDVAEETRKLIAKAQPDGKQSASLLSQAANRLESLSEENALLHNTIDHMAEIETALSQRIVELDRENRELTSIAAGFTQRIDQIQSENLTLRARIQSLLSAKGCQCIDDTQCRFCSALKDLAEAELSPPTCHCGSRKPLLTVTEGGLPLSKCPDCGAFS